VLAFGAGGDCPAWCRLFGTIPLSIPLASTPSPAVTTRNVSESSPPANALLLQEEPARSSLSRSPHSGTVHTYAACWPCKHCHLCASLLGCHYKVRPTEWLQHPNVLSVLEAAAAEPRPERGWFLLRLLPLSVQCLLPDLPKVCTVCLSATFLLLPPTVTWNQGSSTNLMLTELPLFSFLSFFFFFWCYGVWTQGLKLAR
jgi:hypothetical protein